MGKLKECPFCGEDAAVLQKKKRHLDYPWRVKCRECGAKSDWCRTAGAAEMHWTMRDGC